MSPSIRNALAAGAALMLLALSVPNVLAGSDGPDPQPAPGATAAEQAGASEADRVTVWSADDAADRSALSNDDIEYTKLPAGCRFLDTRNTVGAFAIGEARDLGVRNADIPGQGGPSGGCDIPTSAVAVDLSLSTTGNSPTNPGFARVGTGGTDPSATVLQFLKNQGTSVTTTAPVNGSGDMRIRVFGASTHLVGDILGFWESSLHATVGTSGAGSLTRGSGVVAVANFGGTGSTPGFWIVTFNRDVSDCTPVASLETSASGVASATLNGPTGEIFVRTRTSTFADADNLDFRLVVEC